MIDEEQIKDYFPILHYIRLIQRYDAHVVFKGWVDADEKSDYVMEWYNKLYSILN